MRSRLSLEQAVELLVGGGVVAVPTDTVYGLAASFSEPDAVARLFGLKRRPLDAPLPVLVDSLQQISRLGVTWPEDARRLGEAFWPGPLTVVVHAAPAIARRVGGTRDSVGIRQPDDPLLRMLLARVGPLAVSSANEHGDPPCTNADEVLDSLGDLEGFDGVLDDGGRRGQVSTVVDLSKGGWSVVREGAISSGVLKGLLG